ncbi:MAG: hypothetical protein IT378_10445 [Sandaracinaceae bacterium]|nr:hypothetical protein [Sandaracinaceae bacterium]
MAASIPCASRAQDGGASIERFDAGVALLRDGRHAEAAAAFRESYRLAPRAATMCNLALTYDRWGPEHHAQAVRAYRTCARDDESGRFRSFAERRVIELERELVLADQGSDGDPDSQEERRRDEPREGPREEPREEPREGPRSETGPAAPLAPRDHSLLVAGAVRGARAGGAVVPGAVLALDAQATFDALLADLGASRVVASGSPEHARLSSAQASATAALALYVVSGVTVAGALALVVIDLALASSAGSTPIALLPTPDGLLLAGAF